MKSLIYTGILSLTAIGLMSCSENKSDSAALTEAAAQSAHTYLVSMTGVT